MGIPDLIAEHLSTVSLHKQGANTATKRRCGDVSNMISNRVDHLELRPVGRERVVFGRHIVQPLRTNAGVMSLAALR